MFRTLSSIISSVSVRSLSAPSLARSTSVANNTGERVLAIALGSNLGDKVRNIETALRILETQHKIRVVDTSFLYESSPMYLKDQPAFINGACLISTALDAQGVLGVLKDIEERLGRTPSIRHGPRVVDLDILFDGSRTYYLNDVPDRDLRVPHPRVQEREFVLRPLADIAPTFIHPVLGRTIQELLTSIQNDKSPVRKIVSFPSRPYDEPPAPSDPEPVIWTWGTKTYLMATLNTTPDSFSDGGDHFSLTAATSYARSSVEAGADMLDIGGYSTRPGSGFISPDEEIKRTVPVIQAIRKYEGNSLTPVPISVDTFRADVAESAIRAGANCINDVYALTGPHLGVANVSVDAVVNDEDEIEVSDGSAMLRTAARLGVPVILMHSRGPADKNKDYSMYSGGVIEGVKKELGSRVQRALRAGVRRWNIIIDPGIGFSKDVEGNLELMRRGAELNAAANAGKRSEHMLPSAAKTGLEGYPVLVGTSRKAYLGRLIGKMTAKDREWATAAAVSAAIQQNADIIRVHNVDAHKDVLIVSDAIYRGSQ